MRVQPGPANAILATTFIFYFEPSNRLSSSSLCVSLVVVVIHTIGANNDCDSYQGVHSTIIMLHNAFLVGRECHGALLDRHTVVVKNIY